MFPEISVKCEKIKRPYQNLAAEIHEKNPEIIILATPHGLALENYISVYLLQKC